MTNNTRSKRNIPEPVRLGTRISAETNEWMDQHSQKIGLTKSAIINIAIEQYRKETETVTHMPKITQLLEHYGLTNKDIR